MTGKPVFAARSSTARPETGRRAGALADYANDRPADRLRGPEWARARQACRS